MRINLLTFGVILALALSIMALVLSGGLVNPDPGVSEAGTWCCESCASPSLLADGAASAEKIKCSGCTAIKQTASCQGQSGGIKLDCTGNTIDNGGNVTCF